MWIKYHISTRPIVTYVTMVNETQGLYSLSGRTSYGKISWSLKTWDSALDISNRSEIWQAPYRVVAQGRSIFPWHQGPCHKYTVVLIGIMWISRLTCSPFHEWFFYRISNLMDISLCSHPSCRKVIAMKFCTWHNSGVTTKPVIHRISIAMEKSFVKWAPGRESRPGPSKCCDNISSISTCMITSVTNEYPYPRAIEITYVKNRFSTKELASFVLSNN